jgi:uroporphyrin-III C-methyltransferase / precorrin-2 dehydrogenase / sirohydrochlorin ferrochelatase
MSDGSFPVALQLKGARVLVIGGGEEAAARALELEAAGARVHRDAPERPAASGAIPANLQIPAEALAGCRLVMGFGAVSEAARRIAEAAREQGIPVHWQGEPTLSSCFPALRHAGTAPSVAVFGGGEASYEGALAELVQPLVPSELAQLRSWCHDHEPQVLARMPERARAQAFWERLLAGPFPRDVWSGRLEQAQRTFLTQLEGEAPAPVGEVFLLGAGPGDPDLLTLRALRLLRLADVVLYDRLVAPAILDLCAVHAERVYVGKRRDQHPVPQESINELLVSYALEGRRVARLKGGDPFIFGRGGEEIETLMARGVPFQVVPGITAASGCAAYAGIPLTHRDYAQSCVFVTGHRKNGILDLDFERLARPDQTVVIYMGLQGLPELVAGLLHHGMPPSMPAALVQQGTTTNQRVVSGPLVDLPGAAAQAQLRAPTLVIVGEVVRLREKLAWFEGGGSGGFWDAGESPQA